MRCTLSIALLTAALAAAFLSLVHARFPQPPQEPGKKLDGQADPLAILDGMLASGDAGGAWSPSAKDSEPLLDALARSVQEELMSLPSFSDRVRKGLAELPSRLQEGLAKYGEKMSDAGSRLSDWIRRSLQPSEPESAGENRLMMSTAAFKPSSLPFPHRPHHIVGKISIRQKISKRIDGSGKQERVESVPRMKTELYEVDDAGHFHKLGSEELVGHPVAVPSILAPTDQEHQVATRDHGHDHPHHRHHHHHHHHHRHHRDDDHAQASQRIGHAASTASLSAAPHHHLRPVKLINEPEFWIRLGLSVAIGCAFTMLIYSIVKLLVVVFIGIPVDHQEDDDEDEEAQKKKLQSAVLAPVCKI